MCNLIQIQPGIYWVIDVLYVYAPSIHRLVCYVWNLYAVGLISQPSYRSAPYM